MEIGIASVASIVVIVWLVGQVVKATPLGNRWIPIICGAVGLGLGLLGYGLGIPDFPANDWYTAAAVGIVSGLGATGINETVKKLSSKDLNSTSTTLTPLDIETPENSSVESEKQVSDEISSTDIVEESTEKSDNEK
jgi:hypothetical protein